ncbi:MAG: sugar-binding transcriptional regulator [Thermaerobacter sp.]|nr:sugar-binding transcriptional regulator [Thermaerobacter sp.]
MVVNSGNTNFAMDMEHRIEAAFDLEEAIVCDPQPETPPDVMVGDAAAEVLVRSLEDRSVVGLSWGMSVAAVVQQISSGDYPQDIMVVPLSGGIGSVRQDIVGNTLVIELARKLDGQGVTIDAPAIVQRASTRDELMQEPTVQRVLGLANKATVALVGIGSLSEMATWKALGYMTDELQAGLGQAGVVGDIGCRFFDINGNKVPNDFDARTIAMDLSDLKAIPRVIGVAWGVQKASAIVGALRSGIVNVLVTDRLTAEAILRVAQMPET